MEQENKDGKNTIRKLSWKQLPRRKKAEIVLSKAGMSSSTRIGPFTIVKLVYQRNGNMYEGWGLSRKDPREPEEVPERGINSAKMEAAKSIVDKLKRKQPKHPYRG